MPRLEFKASKRPSIEIGGNVVLGRSADHADIVIQDKRLSRKHCEFTQEADRWFVRDMSSANGTKINDVEVLEKSELSEGDEVSLGGIIATFLLADVALELDDTGDIVLEDDFSAAAAAADEVDLMPTLKLLSGTLRARVVPIERSPFKIGRREGNHLVLREDPQASGSHAEIVEEKNGWVLRDLGSTNGTRVDGKAATETLLNEGARIQVGSQLFVFTLLGEGNGEVAPSADGGDLRLEGSGGDDDDEIEILDDLDQLSELDNLDEEVEEGVKEDAKRLEHVAVDTQGSGKGKMVFRIAEVAVLLVAMGALGWLLNNVFAHKPTSNEGGDTSNANATSGVLLDLSTGDDSFVGYGSFERAGNKDLHGWRQILQDGNDKGTFAVGDALDGDYRFLLKRGNSTGKQSRWVRDLFIPLTGVEGGDRNTLELSINHKREGGAGTMVFAFVEWYSEARESALIFSETRGFIQAGNDWAEMLANFTRPANASYARVGVGVAGNEGAIALDKAVLNGNSSGQSFSALKGEKEGSLYLEMRPDARLTLFGVERARNVEGVRGSTLARVEYWSNVNLVCQDKQGIEQQRIGDWLSEAPKLSKSAGTYQFVDPRSGTPRTMTVEWKGTRLSISDQQSGADLRMMGLRGTATQVFLKQDIVAMNRNGAILEFASDLDAEVPVEASFADMQGARRMRFEGPLRLEFHDRLLAMVSEGKAFNVTFEVQTYTHREGKAFLDWVRSSTGQRQRLRAYESSLLEMLLLASEGSERGIEARVDKAMELAQHYPFDLQALGIARDSARDVEDFYQERLYETESLVSGALGSSENPEHFVASVLRAKSYAGLISKHAVSWRAPAASLETLAKSSELPEAYHDRLQGIVDSVSRISDMAARFRALVAKGNVAAFEITSRAQSHQAGPLLDSAMELIADGEKVQAELKLRSIPKRFPYTREATKARRLLLERAEELRSEGQELLEEGLKVIADEKFAQARTLAEEVSASSTEMLKHEGLDITRVFKVLGDKPWIQISEANWRIQEEDIRKDASALAQ